MPKQDKYCFMPSFSLEPNKLTTFNQVFVRDTTTNNLKHPSEFRRTKAIKFQKVVTNKIVNKSFHNFTLSDSARRTLKRRINWLYYLAKSKYVKSYSGKEIYNFKIGFITLTLPSKQRSCTNEVTNKLLNNFLTEIRQRTNMKNYIWKLEFQKNGNVHYHIVTDTYLDYFFVLKIWNRILKLNGYISPYRDKHKDLSLLDYNKMYNKNKKIEFNVIAKRYAKQKSNNWEQPNSVDCKPVISKRAISYYMSKYFLKNDKNSTKCNELDNESNSESLRLWFCSRSLSKLKSISNFCEAVEYDLLSIIEVIKDVKRFTHSYAISFHFDIHKAVGWSRQFLERLLKDYSKRQGYIPA